MTSMSIVFLLAHVTQVTEHLPVLLFLLEVDAAARVAPAPAAPQDIRDTSADLELLPPPGDLCVCCRLNCSCAGNVAGSGDSLVLVRAYDALMLLQGLDVEVDSENM